jgi:prolyl-tRNA editing enzyme YbaK/EbsC (Cys-tRNA(Pro) deacylase)
VLGEFRDLRAFGPSAAGPAPRALLRFSFGHVGGDCTPFGARSNWDLCAELKGHILTP